MKKLVAVFMGAVLSLCLFGCEGKPDGMTESVYRKGIAVCDLTQEYLDGKAGREETTDRVFVQLGDIKTLKKSAKDAGVELCVIGVHYALEGSASQEQIKKELASLEEELR